MIALFVIDSDVSGTGDILTFSEEVVNADSHTLRPLIRKHGFTLVDVSEVFIIEGTLKSLDPDTL